MQAFGHERAVKAIAYQVSGEAERQTRAYVAVAEDGTLVLNLLRSKMNLLTGQRRTTVKKRILPPLPAGVKVKTVVLTERADAVFVADEEGKVYRYNTGGKRPVLAEISQVISRGQSSMLLVSSGAANQ